LGLFELGIRKRARVDESYRAIAAFLAICLVGCSPVGGSSLESARDVADPGGKKVPSSQIDGGVIFADEASYLCFPLDRFGVASAELFDHLESSCQCVRPSLVRYVGPSGQTIDGLRFDFVHDAAVRESVTNPSSLAVEVRLSLTDSDVRVITVQFLQTKAIADDLIESKDSHVRRN